MTHANRLSGIYAAFAPIKLPEISIVVYPNPVHRKKGNLIHFTGTSIHDIQIYFADGYFNPDNKLDTERIMLVRCLIRMNHITSRSILRVGKRIAISESSSSGPVLSIQKIAEKPES